MGHYLRLYRTINKTFGFWLRPLGAFLILQVRQAISATTLGLDHLVYPRYRTAGDRPADLHHREPAKRHHVPAPAAAGGRRDGRLRAVGDALPGHHGAQAARRRRPAPRPALARALPPFGRARHQPARHRDRRRAVVLPDARRSVRLGVLPCLAGHLGKRVVPARIGDQRRDCTRRRSLLSLPRGVLATEPDIQALQPHPGQDEHAHSSPGCAAEALPRLQARVRRS